MRNPSGGDGASCADIREHLNAYADGELPREAEAEVRRHLAACARCGEESRQIMLLRRTIAGSARAHTAPAEVRTAIGEVLAADSAHTSSRAWIAAAAAILIVGATVWSLAVYLTGHSPPALLAQERYIDSILARVRSTIGLGLGDHLHCTVYRQILHGPVEERDLTKSMGREFAPLAAVVRDKISESSELRLAHRCRYRGRTYVHLAVAGEDGSLLSVILTPKEGDDSLAAAGVLPVARASGVAIFAADEDGYQIAAFETEQDLGFVVSDLDRETNLRLAEILVPGVRDVIANLAG